MLNDVIFNDKSARYDWNIILTKAVIPLPSIKTAMVDIKGADGILDLSEVLTGDVVYSNRNIKLTFALMDVNDYPTLISEISNYIHGKKIKISLTTDSEYYYVGRAYIDQYECANNVGTIVIGMSAEPYKYYKNETVCIIDVFANTTVKLNNDRMRVLPTLTVSGTVTMNFEGKEYQLSEGEQQILNFTLKEGDNLVTFSGIGKVKINYREGRL